MIHLDPSSLLAFLQFNWGWAAGLAGSMLALTALAGSLLNPARKDEIARWLMGAHTEESWSKASSRSSTPSSAPATCRSAASCARPSPRSSPSR